MRYQGRLPDSLDDLAGPAHGTVQLPLHIAWPGMTEFDLDRPKHCAMMYHIVLTEGQLGRIIRDVWESAFPAELNDSEPDNA